MIGDDPKQPDEVDAASAVREPTARSSVLAADDAWFIARGELIAGPHSWSVVRELHGAGALGPEDQLWRRGTTQRMRADAYPELYGAPTSQTPRPAAWKAAVGPVWLLLALTYIVGSLGGWPGPSDVLMLARLKVFGFLVLLVTSYYALPAAWRMPPDEGTRRIPLHLLRIALASAVFGLIFLASVILSNSSDLVRIAFGHDPHGSFLLRVLPERQLEVRGMLGAGIARQVADTLVLHPEIRILHLNSPGGWVAEGEALATIIREHGLSTYTATGCYSACTIAFAAGKHRTINREARLGLHSSSGEGMDPWYVNRINTGWRDQLRKLGATERFVSRAMETPPASLWFPLNTDAIENGMLDAELDADELAPSGEDLTFLVPMAKAIEANDPILAPAMLARPETRSRVRHSLLLALRRGAARWEIDDLISTLAKDSGPSSDERSP